MAWLGSGSETCIHGDEDGKCNQCYDTIYLPNLHERERFEILAAIDSPVLQERLIKSWKDISSDGFTALSWRLNDLAVRELLRKGGGDTETYNAFCKCKELVDSKL